MDEPREEDIQKLIDFTRELGHQCTREEAILAIRDVAKTEEALDRR